MSECVDSILIGTEMEWMPSATIALERPNMPAPIFNTDKAAFTQKPTHVTWRATLTARSGVTSDVCLSEGYAMKCNRWSQIYG